MLWQRGTEKCKHVPPQTAQTVLEMSQSFRLGAQEKEGRKRFDFEWRPQGLVKHLMEQTTGFLEGFLGECTFELMHENEISSDQRRAFLQDVLDFNNQSSRTGHSVHVPPSLQENITLPKTSEQQLGVNVLPTADNGEIGL